MKRIRKEVVEQAMSYASYRNRIDELFAANKTTGDNHSEAMLHYTKMNISRMNRLDRTTRLEEKVLESIAAIRRPLTLLVITEAWCGDAAQSLPVIHKIAEASENISLKLILRDQHLDIMDAFLTNGGRSIPKLIILDDATLEVLNTWGPRPETLQKMVVEGGRRLKLIEDPVERKQAYQELSTATQKWYARDKTKSIQQELADALESTIAVTT